jgi:hypothetical protein
VQFAQAVARTRCALKDKFDALNIRKGHKKSIVALAHKMLRTIYAILTNGSHYQDRSIDYLLRWTWPKTHRAIPILPFHILNHMSDSQNDRCALGAFGHSQSLTMGVELELQLLSTNDYDLTPQANDMLRVLKNHSGAWDVKPRPHSA